MAIRESFGTHVRIAVPPGIGDTYWAITKLHDFRRKNLIKHVTLCVKKNPLVRALDWAKLTPLVDATEEFDFTPNREVKRTGYSTSYAGVDCVMWPNAVIDAGYHLRDWLPKYELDLDFPMNVPKDEWVAYEVGKMINTSSRRFIVYASSEGVNKNWFPGRGVEFWNGVLTRIYERTGDLPVLIGAGWDEEFAKGITAPCINLIGKTSLGQVAALIKNAHMLVGIISGMTILANNFRTPCVAIYPDSFKPGFLSSWIKPNTPYIPVPQSITHSPIEFAEMGLRISD